MYPLLTTAVDNSTFPAPFFIPPYILHPNGSSNQSANGTVPPPPPLLNFSWWNVTVGEVRNYWLSVCQTPAFVELAQSQPAKNFTAGWEGNTRNHTAAISPGFFWAGQCLTNLSNVYGSGNQSLQLPPGYQGLCSFAVYWTGEFLPNGTTNSSGPREFEGLAVYSFGDSSPGSRGPSAGVLLGIGWGTWVILGSVVFGAVAAILIIGRARREESETRPTPAGVPAFVVPESPVAPKASQDAVPQTNSPHPSGPGPTLATDKSAGEAPGRELLDDLL